MTYPAFGKIPRLNRPVVISEKIDGTNGLICIAVEDEDIPLDAVCLDYVAVGGVGYSVFAGSRNRWLSTEKGADNHGFAAWVEANAQALAETLGEGHHYGEWWGQGIQRNYGLTEKRFSLFNTHRWQSLDVKDVYPNRPEQLDVVPILYQGPMHTPHASALRSHEMVNRVDNALEGLRQHGSKAAPGFMNPEGIVIYHTAGGHYYKATIVGDEGRKG